MSHPCLKPFEAPVPRLRFRTHQEELEVVRLQLLGRFSVDHLLTDTNVRFILHEDDALTCPCVRVCKLNGDLIFAFEGTLSVKEISEHISRILQVEDGQISFFVNDEQLTDRNHLLDFKKLRHNFGSSSLFAILEEEECSRCDRFKGTGKGKLKKGGKSCKDCGEQPWYFEHSSTPRCRCGWW